MVFGISGLVSFGASAQSTIQDASPRADPRYVAERFFESVERLREKVESVVEDHAQVDALVAIDNVLVSHGAVDESNLVDEMADLLDELVDTVREIRLNHAKRVTLLQELSLAVHVPDDWLAPIPDDNCNPTEVAALHALSVVESASLLQARTDRVGWNDRFRARVAEMDSTIPESLDFRELAAERKQLMIMAR